MVRAKCSAPPSVEVVAVDRGDRPHGARPSLATASPIVLRLAASSAPGRPVRTLQKAQARVQVSPMIMKVACFFSQHSPILGQPASSQTVTSPCSRTIVWVSAQAWRARRLHADPVRLLAWTGWSGRCAFSGWRRRTGARIVLQGVEDDGHGSGAATPRGSAQGRGQDRPDLRPQAARRKPPRRRAAPRWLRVRPFRQIPSARTNSPASTAPTRGRPRGSAHSPSRRCPCRRSAAPRGRRAARGRGPG